MDKTIKEYYFTICAEDSKFEIKVGTTLVGCIKVKEIETNVQNHTDDM